MAWFPTTNQNLPSDLCESLNEITKEIDSYIEEFDRNENKMTEIKEEFDCIGKKVSEITRRIMVTGLVVGAVGLLGALFTGGASLGLAAAGGVIALLAALSELLIQGGLAVIIQIKISELQTIIVPLGKILAKIEKICDEMEERSRNNHREEVKELLWLVRKVKSSSEAGRRQTVKLDGFLRVILELIARVIRKVVTGEETKRLCDLLIESGDQCRMTISELRNVKIIFVEFKIKVYSFPALK